MIHKEKCLTFLSNAKDHLSSFFSTKSSTFMHKYDFSSFGNLKNFIDEMTGYDKILSLKEAVNQASEGYDNTNRLFKEAHTTHQLVVDERALLQKNLQSLLSRKATWSDDEISSFTKLYKDEIRAESKEKEARSNTKKAEDSVEVAHARLVHSMRERYQGEQAWSDKIRALSTAGTFSLIALNILIFIYMQTVIEPKKRSSLIQSIMEMKQDEKIKTLSEMGSSTIPLDTLLNKLDAISLQVDSIRQQPPQHIPFIDTRFNSFYGPICLSIGGAFLVGSFFSLFSFK